MYGEESVAILTDFIEAVGKSGKKNEIIEEWENLIINFYKRSNSKKIFEGQLILAYQSRLGNARNSSKVNVASWVKKMFFYKEQSQISNLQEIMRKSSFSSSALKNIGEKIDENEKIINEKKDKVAFFSEKSVDTLKTYDYWDYYMYILPAKIEEGLINRDCMVYQIHICRC